jgi:hypothetical protein
MRLTAAGIAAVIIAILLFRGTTGRVGMILLVILGGALSIVGDLRDMFIGILDAFGGVANSVGGSL